MQTRTLRCAIVWDIRRALRDPFGCSRYRSDRRHLGTECRQIEIQPRPSAEERIAHVRYGGQGGQGDVHRRGADGKPTAGEWIVVNDGKDTPMTGNRTPMCFH